MSETTVAPAQPHAEGHELAPGYEVLAHVSRSKVLDIYDLWSERRDCRCIGKVLRPDHEGDQAAVARLLDEGRLLLGLTHPHVVRAYELLTEPQPTLVLETVSGATLGHLIRSSPRRLALADVAELGLQLAAALHYLHAEGILHLDVKPANVVSDRGFAKLLDLSLALTPGPCPRGRGTRLYQSPEQARGEDVSAASDVWGLAATLYRVATRARPFDGEEPRRRSRPRATAATDAAGAG